MKKLPTKKSTKSTKHDLEILARTISYDEAQEKMLIDENCLRDEIANQARLHARIGQSAAYAKAMRDYHKQRVAEIFSEIILEIQTKEKVTKQISDAKAEIDPRYIQAKRDYAKAIYEYERWETMERAFHKRADMVKELSQHELNIHRDHLKLGTANTNIHIKTGTEGRKALAQKRKPFTKRK